MNRDILIVAHWCIIYTMAACFFITFFYIYFQGGEACFTLKLFSEQQLEAVIIMLGVLSPAAAWSIDLHRKRPFVRKLIKNIIKK